MIIYSSESLDPFTHLALEEHLLDTEPEEVCLLFWRSQSAVVMGKNQNPWRELNLNYCRRHEIQIARRISGGGAVYQDPGNLNYALILPRERYQLDAILHGLAHTFSQNGIETTPLMGNSLGHAGKKFSGHAFSYRKAHVLHHGTLLINAHLDHLRASLRPPPLSIQTHAVASRPAPVGNLIDAWPGLQQEDVKHWVSSACGKVLNEPVPGEGSPFPTSFQAREARERFASRTWIWDRTPAFSIPMKHRGQKVSVHFRHGRVESFAPSGNAYSELDSLIGKAFDDPQVKTHIPELS